MPATITVMAPSANQVIQAQDGTVYTADANRRIASVSAGRDLIDLIAAGCKVVPDPELAPRLPMAASKFYGINPGDTLAAVLTVVSKIYAYPIFIPNEITVNTLSVNTTTGQTGGVARLGIYADNNGVPGNLIIDGGELTGLTATAINTKTLATPVVLKPGWYWLASAFSASSTQPSVAGVSATLAGGAAGNMGGDTAARALATAATSAVTGVIGDLTYGALPSSFPTITYQVNATTPAVALGL